MALGVSPSLRAAANSKSLLAFYTSRAVSILLKTNLLRISYHRIGGDAHLASRDAASTTPKLLCTR